MPKFGNVRSRSVYDGVMTEEQQVTSPVRRRREAAVMGQNELAKKSGIGRSSLCEYEAGKYVPKPRRIRALARALGVAPVELDAEIRAHVAALRERAGHAA
jgi:transcriptional regulator with XRE-family HTH domain